MSLYFIYKNKNKFSIDMLEVALTFFMRELNKIVLSVDDDPKVDPAVKPKLAASYSEIYKQMSRYCLDPRVIEEIPFPISSHYAREFRQGQLFMIEESEEFKVTALKTDEHTLKRLSEVADAYDRLNELILAEANPEHQPIP